MDMASGSGMASDMASGRPVKKLEVYVKLQFFTAVENGTCSQSICRRRLMLHTS